MIGSSTRAHHRGGGFVERMDALGQSVVKRLGLLFSHKEDDQSFASSSEGWRKSGRLERRAMSVEKTRSLERQIRVVEWASVAIGDELRGTQEQSAARK